MTLAQLIRTYKGTVKLYNADATGILEDTNLLCTCSGDSELLDYIGTSSVVGWEAAKNSKEAYIKVWVDLPSDESNNEDEETETPETGEEE